MATDTATKSTHKFQAEVTKVLSLVINSLYKNKEVFLRELLSNASDALDKLRFRAITEPGLLQDGEKLGIRIIVDADKKTLTIWDNGIGMTAEDLARELGTVAQDEMAPHLVGFPALRSAPPSPGMPAAGTGPDCPGSGSTGGPIVTAGPRRSIPGG